MSVFKGELGAQLDCVTRCLFTRSPAWVLQVSSATSLKQCVLAGGFAGGFAALVVRKRDRELPGLIGKRSGLIFVTGFSSSYRKRKGCSFSHQQSKLASRQASIKSVFFCGPC
jgi:hypothetical protein